MKKLLFAVLALASVSAFSADVLKSMSKGALRTGTVAQGSYEFLKVEYKERDGFQPRSNRKVIASISGLSQKKDPRFSQNVGQSGSENMGRATDIKTSLSIKIQDGNDTYGCLLSSRALDDGMDPIGHNDAELGCRVVEGNRTTRITLKDYSENRVDGAKAFYELIVESQSEGLFSKARKYFEAEIEAK